MIMRKKMEDRAMGKGGYSPGGKLQLEKGGGEDRRCGGRKWTDREGNKKKSEFLDTTSLKTREDQHIGPAKKNTRRGARVMRKVWEREASDWRSNRKD